MGTTSENMASITAEIAEILVKKSGLGQMPKLEQLPEPVLVSAPYGMCSICKKSPAIPKVGMCPKCIAIHHILHKILNHDPSLNTESLEELKAILGRRPNKERYSKFCNTRWWRLLGKYLRMYHGDRCCDCGRICKKTYVINGVNKTFSSFSAIHHLTYENLLNSKIDDYQVLCHRHHAMRHEILDNGYVSEEEERVERERIQQDAIRSVNEYGK